MRALADPHATSCSDPGLPQDRTLLGERVHDPHGVRGEVQRGCARAEAYLTSEDEGYRYSLRRRACDLLVAHDVGVWVYLASHHALRIFSQQQYGPRNAQARF
jgi:hypothetical protein